MFLKVRIVQKLKEGWICNMSVNKVIKNDMVIAMIGDKLKVFFCGTQKECYQYCVDNGWVVKVGQGRGKKPIEAKLQIQKYRMY